LKKITHIITELNIGGAEKMLYKLLQNIDRKKKHIEVISLQDEGFYGPKIKKLGIKVHAINMKRVPTLKNLLDIKKILKNTDIVQTWMYHADFIGYLSTRFNKKQKLLWSIRRTNLNKEENKKSTLIIAKLNSLFSKRVDTIISCSISAKQSHIEYKYSENNIIIIPNGFEMDKLFYNPIGKHNIRRKLGLEDKKVILNIGRWNIAKDHKNLIQAYRKIESNKTHLIMIGPGITNENKDLMKIIQENKLENYSLLGPQFNIQDYLSAADIYVSASMSEGFPNVIGEAMACELPCVVTNAGDSSYIVDNTGIVVPIKDSSKLAEAISKMLSFSYEKRRKLGAISRKRIEENFDIKVVTKMFEKQYK